MSKSDKELRASLYFSRRKDKDIISEIGFEGLEKGDINWILKELMRDGIKYRKGVHPSSRNVAPPPHAEQSSAIPNENATREVTFPSSPIVVYEGFGEEDDLFEDVQLVVKELDEEEIANKLEDF